MPFLLLLAILVGLQKYINIFKINIKVTLFNSYFISKFLIRLYVIQSQNVTVFTAITTSMLLSGLVMEPGYFRWAIR
jgi:hypothetical protein